MYKPTVIIPSATIVEKGLQNLGRLPAIIYPVNQKTVFNYLYEQYKNNEKIEILLFENEDKVRRRLQKYEDENVVLTKIPSLSDLGHTIYYGLKGKNGPVIINFADTIITGDIDSLENDSFLFSEDYFSETWTYFEEQNGVITKIYDKSIELRSQKNKGKLIVGVFQVSNAQYFKRCLEKAFQGYEEKISTFYYALKLYSIKYPMKPIKTETWFDIGHVDRYYNSKLEVRAREFNHISIDKERGMLRKCSDDKDKFIGEIKWYLKLPADVEYVRPRIYDYSTSYEDPYIVLEYYAYHTLHELYLYGDLSYHQWMDIFNRIKFVCRDFRRYTVRDNKIVDSLEEMYLLKTLERLDIMKKNKVFRVFFDRTVTVNEKTYLSLDEICGVLKKIIPEMLYDIDSFSIIHGDLCFANIMVDGNLSFIKVIDPRGKFGQYDIYGDPRYELAKLFHSVDGKYDFIIKDLFDITYKLEEAKINYQIRDRERNFDLYQAFLEAFHDEIGNDLKKIKLIEALLFLSMIPLHNESLAHQMVMLGTGLDILNKVTDITTEGIR